MREAVIVSTARTPLTSRAAASSTPRPARRWRPFLWRPQWSGRAGRLSLAIFGMTRGASPPRSRPACIQLHGAIGMTWELPLSHYAKRLVMVNNQLGDEDHYLARFVALGRD